MKTINLLFCILTISFTGFTQSLPDFSVKTTDGIPVRAAKVLVSNDITGDVDTLYTGEDGGLLKSTGPEDGDSLATGLKDITNEALHDFRYRVSPSPGASHNLYRPVDRGFTGDIGQIVNINGQVIDKVEVKPVKPGLAQAFWDGDGAANGVYIFQSGDKSVKLVHHNAAIEATPFAAPPQEVVLAYTNRLLDQERSLLKSGTDSTVNDTSYTITVMPTDSSNVLGDTTSFTIDGSTDTTTLDSSAMITATEYEYWFKGRANVFRGKVAFFSEKDSAHVDTLAIDTLYKYGLYNTRFFEEGIELPFRAVAMKDMFIADQKPTDTVPTGRHREDFTLGRYKLDTIQGTLRTEEFSLDSSNLMPYATVRLRGKDVSYDSTSSLSPNFLNDSTDLGVAEYRFRNLAIAAKGDLGEEIDSTEYVVEIDPTVFLFKPFVDTLKLYEMQNFNKDFVLESWQFQRPKGEIRDFLTGEVLEGVTVRLTNADTTYETTTNSSGFYKFPRQECGSSFTVEAGYLTADSSNYLARERDLTTKDVNKSVSDTSKLMHFTLLPREYGLQATENDPYKDTTIAIDPYEVLGLSDGGSGVDLEQVVGNKVNIYVGDLSEDYQMALETAIRTGDSIFHGISLSTPLTHASRPFKLVDSVASLEDYGYVFNGDNSDLTLGWNVELISDPVVAVKGYATNMTNIDDAYSEFPRLTGLLRVPLNQADFDETKMLQALYFNIEGIYSRSGFWQGVLDDRYTPSAPSIRDRVYDNLLGTSAKNRWLYKFSSYGLDDLKYNLE